MEEKLAIVELSNSHDECMLSQLVALKRRDCHVTMVSTEVIRERNPWFNQYIDAFKKVEVTGSAIGDLKKMLELLRFFKEEKISKVVFNTAQGGHVRNLCLFAPSDIEFIGIIHTLNKFRGSFTQRIINRKIKKYFVLNDYFLKFIPEWQRKQVRSFYPLRFPQFPKRLEKPEGEIWITVIGGVENRRKDLVGSVDLIGQLPETARVIFLGKSDPGRQDFMDFHRELNQQGLAHRVLTFDHFVDQATFHAYMMNTDLVWTMIHPDAECAKEYFSNQIPGALNAALAYHVPMLNHKYYVERWSDLQYSISYTRETFAADLIDGMKRQDQLRKSMGSSKNLQVEFQEENFAEYVFSKRFASMR